jgi:hypothetical protein
VSCAYNALHISSVDTAKRHWLCGAGEGATPLISLVLDFLFQHIA